MRCSYAQHIPAAAGFIICAALQFYTSVVAHIRIFVIAFLIDFARFTIYDEWIQSYVLDGAGAGARLKT